MTAPRQQRSRKGAAKAIEFYTKAFGAEETVRMPGPNGSILHGEIMEKRMAAMGS